MIINNITLNEIAFLNNFSFKSLDCFERPMCTIFQNLNKNSMYYFLFFYILKASYFKNNYWKFLKNKIGLEAELDFKSSIDFYKIIDDKINRGKHLLFGTNLYYHPSAKRFYKQIHHTHYTILKGYTEKQDKYIVIDEDYSIWTSENIGGRLNSIPYIEAIIEKEAFKDICCNISYTPIKDRNYEKVKQFKNEFFGFFEIVENPSYKSYSSISTILNIYHDHLDSFIAKFEEYIETLKEKAVEFDKNINTHNQNFNNRLKNAKETFDTIAIVYYQQINNDFSIHYKSIIILNKILHLYNDKDNLDIELIKKSDELLNHHFTIQNIFIKSIISKKSCSNKIIKILDIIILLEPIVYRAIQGLSFKHLETL